MQTHEIQHMPYPTTWNDLSGHLQREHAWKWIDIVSLHIETGGETVIGTHRSQHKDRVRVKVPHEHEEQE